MTRQSECSSHPTHTLSLTHQPHTPEPTQQAGSDDLVAMAGNDPPDPIPNSAVKNPSAHDTAPQGAGKSIAARSSEPAYTLNKRDK